MPTSLNVGPLFHLLRIGKGNKNSPGKLTILAGSSIQVDGIMRMTPQAAPASCTLGDMYVDSTSKFLRVCTVTGTPGTWQTVGVQTP